MYSDSEYLNAAYVRATKENDDFYSWIFYAALCETDAVKTSTLYAAVLHMARTYSSLD